MIPRVGMVIGVADGYYPRLGEIFYLYTMWGGGAFGLRVRSPTNPHRARPSDAVLAVSIVVYLISPFHHKDP